MVSPGPHRYCLKCDYPLDDVASSKCPECGRAFDPTDPASVSARPTARRRRWIRRGLILAGVIVALEIFGPSRVARFTWTWPNADGVTCTSETRWHVLGPSWLPIQYARFSTRRWTQPMPGGYLNVADYSIWRIGLAWVWRVEACTSSSPRTTRTYTFGAIDVGPPGLPVKMGPPWKTLTIHPGNFDALADALLQDPRRQLNWSPHGLNTYPPEANK
jgi:hypothetical protein